nr:uncharacterized protein LOC108947473 [Nicotiana tomentosiformis]
MMSSTCELIIMAASNSHIIFCFCNFIIAILLLGGFQPSSEDNNTNLDHSMSKRKEALGTPKPKRFQKGMNLDCEIRKMDNTSQEIHTFSVSSHTSSREVLRNIKQDNKSEAYDDAARFHYYGCANIKQSHRQATIFQSENVEEASANGTIDRTICLEITKKETNVNNFEKCDEKEEDELRKRIEDFIEKVNRGWRAEKLGICYQSQGPNLSPIMSYSVCVFANMLSSTFELLNQTNYNSFVAFIFCNLIIVILLVNSSKPSSKISDNKLVPLSIASEKNNCSVLDKNNGLANAVEAMNNCNENETIDHEEEDELKRKVEEFIQKVNRCWKAEKMSAYK